MNQLQSHKLVRFQRFSEADVAWIFGVNAGSVANWPNNGPLAPDWTPEQVQTLVEAREDATRRIVTKFQGDLRRKGPGELFSHAEVARIMDLTRGAIYAWKDPETGDRLVLTQEAVQARVQEISQEVEDIRLRYDQLRAAVDHDRL